MEKKSSKALRSLSLSINQLHLLSYMQRPVLSVLISYLAGILLQNSLRFLDYQYLFFISLVIFLLFLLSCKKCLNITGILLLLFFIVIGMLNSSYHLQPHGSNHIYHFSGQKGQLFGTVYQTEINHSNDYQQVQLNTSFFQYQNELYQTSGRVLLRIYGVEPVFQFGDNIKAQVLLQEPGLPGNFGEFNYRDYLLRKNIFLTDNIKIEQVEILGYSEKLTIFSFIYGMRDKITERINQIYQAPDRGLIKAIITGNRTEIPREWIHLFQDAGVMHILAISGLHVGMIVMFLFFFLNLLPANGMKNSYRYLTIIFILLGYAAMTGFRPSVSRAAIMFIIVLAGRYFNRPYHLYNSLYLAAFLLLLWQPLYLFDAGFLLSFVVTFFIIFLSPILEEKLRFLPLYLAKPLSVSLSAWLGMAPLSAYFFYKISLIAILSNILIVPLIGIILILALISIFLSFFVLPLAGLFALLNQALIGLLLLIGQRLSLLPFAYQYIAQPEVYLIILYYLVILTFFYTLHFWSQYNILEKKHRFWTITTLVFLLLFIHIISPSSLLSVHFINVGQGDCILIQTPQKEHILIDGGGTPFGDFDVGQNTVIPYLRREGINRINLMILTHPDLDHLEGLLPVLKEMQVNLVIDSGLDYQHETYLEYRSLIMEDQDTDHYHAGAGDVIQISPDIEFFVLNPDKTIAYGYKNNFNNNSIVLKLRYNNTSFLFTGDIEEAAETILLSWSDSLKSDILKVAHHGSNSSTGTIFLENVRPEVAVISVGANNFGHPHHEVIKKLEDECQQVFRTDLNGTVLIKSNGNQYYINTLR